MTNGIIDEAPPCQKCGHYKHEPGADPIHQHVCLIGGPVNARYQRDEHCFGRWFVWREGQIAWPKAGAKR